MLTIVQECPAPACDGHVRYRTSIFLATRNLRGNREVCGRAFRLVAGRPAAIDRRRVGRRDEAAPGAA